MPSRCRSRIRERSNTHWPDLSTLATRGLSFDLQIFPHQLDQAAQLAANHPDTTIILDHAGCPYSAIRSPSGAGGQHAKTGKQPNVVTEISALGTNDHSWTRGSIRPVILGTIDAFGPQRTMFGSNFPVDSLYSSFTALYIWIVA